MNAKFAGAVAAIIIAVSNLWAGGGKTYQVTGTVVEVTATKIALQKGTDRWELDVGPETKGSGQTFKAGDKVTITYTMSATSIEDKGPAGSPEKQKKP